MARFTRRNYMDATGYKAALATRERATREFQQFLELWCPAAKQQDLDKIVRELIYAHQQTVSYQTDHDVDAQDIHVY